MSFKNFEMSHPSWLSHHAGNEDCAGKWELTRRPARMQCKCDRCGQAYDATDVTRLRASNENAVGYTLQRLTRDGMAQLPPKGA